MRRFLLTAVLAFALSMIAKFIVDTYVHVPVHIIGTFAGLYPTHNPGVAFGVTLPPILQELLILIALFFVCMLAWKTRGTILSQIGYGLIVGGALANIVDRIPDGLVTDFVQIGNFAIFNIADSCITIGAVFLLAEAFGLVRNR
ncbi:MAG TPA: signal peptidase II [Candidatus Peribacteraceae bacterium]|nr:signal peptidase II [Candidatus Peribacteraceae bacterium]